MLKQKILQNLKIALKKVGIEQEEILLEHPTNPNFGDYATSLPLKLTKQLKKSPLQIAQKIANNLPKDNLVEKVEIITPGFINFWINDSYFLDYARKILAEKFDFPKFHLGKNKKIMVEFAHPNTHKLFHIGHLRNISSGESLCRMVETVGNKVIRANYQGDVGLHIAKCLYKVKSEKLKVKSLKTIGEKIRFLGETYAEGNKTYENDKKAKKEIIEINRMIYEQDLKILPLWKETRQWSLDYFEEIYNRVYTQFDRLYFESELPKRGIQIIKECLKKGILKKSEGAIIFKGKLYSLDTRVFVNALGIPTYEGKELALAEKEFCEFGKIDKCIHVVGPEQSSFFKVTFKVEELLDEKKYKNKQLHLIGGWVRLKHGKMSSRAGNVVEGAWLLDEAKRRIIKKYHCDEKVAETIAVASVKYSFLKNNISADIAFDFDESISLEGNSGPYLLYTYVRTQSVLKKTNLNNLTIQQFNNLTIKQEENNLLRSFYQFPEIVFEAAKNFSPNLIANYLFDLSQKYNLFYQKHPILKAEKNTKDFRLLLTKAAGQIIKNGLYLLGIKTVEKM
jgi:arginyl-tRNA synthetase